MKHINWKQRDSDLEADRKRKRLHTTPAKRDPETQDTAAERRLDAVADQSCPNTRSLGTGCMQTKNLAPGHQDGLNPDDL